jgi:hypothetical protein
MLLMVLASLVSAFCFGQEMDLAPPAEVKKFDWMLGDWTAKSTFVMPEMPAMDVTMSIKCEWDGQFLKQTAVNDFGLMKMTETFYLGFDPESKKYVSFAFTNLAPVPRIERGALVGDVLTMVSDPWSAGGQTHISRATMSKVGPSEMTMKLEFQVDGKWVTAMDAVFKKTK